MELTIVQILNQAITLHQKGSFEEAEKLYREILNRDPMQIEANNNLGILLYGLNRFNEAETIYKKLIEIQPDNIDAYNDLAIILNNLGKLEDSKYIIKKVLSLKPDYAEGYNNLGITYKNNKELEKAEVNYKKAIELKPDYAEAYNNYGNLLRGLNRLDEAEIKFKKAIELKPNFVLAYNNLGILFKELSKTEEAEVNYKKAIELKPDYTDAYNNYGNLLRGLNRLDEAEKISRKAIQLNPKSVAAFVNLGSIYKKLNKIDIALINYNKALELSPDNEVALLNRGQINFDIGNFEFSIKDFDRVNSAESRMRSLTSLYSLGRIDEIYKRIKDYSELDSENLKIAAFASFIASKEKKKTENKFCNDPINFIKNSNLSSHFKNSDLFINEVINELNDLETVWEPITKSTYNGFQSVNNLFYRPSGKLAELKSIILTELDLYYTKFKNESCNFIRKWPSKKNLQGWHVVLKEQGYQNLHMHQAGWLSGVIYLKVVPSLEKNEGAIEFSLDGEYYSDINSPKSIYEPNVGDMIFFPSSLHHRTVPFTTKTDRIIISFDLFPHSNKINLGKYQTFFSS